LSARHNIMEDKMPYGFIVSTEHEIICIRLIPKSAAFVGEMFRNTIYTQL